jgi:long-chain acyl-CoA synthetase
VRRWGDRTAFLHHDVPLTFTELGRRAAAVANALADRGVGRGDVVAVHLPNCRQYPAVYYGVLMAGAVFSPTNPLLPPAELAAQLADAGARALVTWEQVLPVVRSAPSGTPVETVVVTGAAHVLDFDARLGALDSGEVDLADLLGDDPVDRQRDAGLDPAQDLAHLAYTGGTTGVSKGVELLHRNVVTNVPQAACWTWGAVPELDAEGDVTVRQVGPEEEYRTRLGEARIINLTPWFHAMGAIGHLNGMVTSGTTVIIHDRFDPAAYVADAVRHRVTSIGGAPPVSVGHPQAGHGGATAVRHRDHHPAGRWRRSAAGR